MFAARPIREWRARSGARRGARTGAGLLIAGLALTGCGSAADSGETTPSATATSASSTAAAADELTLKSGWAKAAPSGMTAVFGTLHNAGEQPIVITGGSSEVATTVETHTMKMEGGSMVMVRKEDGFTVPAGGELTLKPGADHIMLLGLKKPLLNGEDLTLKVTTKAGGEVTLTVPVRDFAGADEKYDPSMSHNASATSNG